MIVLNLDIHAYHQLESIHYVTVSETGHIAQPRDSRARWYIFVDKDNKLKCRKYTGNKGSDGDFFKEKRSHLCRVKPNFERITKFFPRS